mgnify:CR=1 FL=1
MADFLQQLAEQKRKVDFNTYDMTTKELVSLVADGTINISPEYQRQFRWEEERQSSLIESIFLGIPVPSLFMATNSDNTWEVIDGVQRLSTIINFVAGRDADIRKKIKKSEPLKLRGLKKLSLFNDHTFDELPSTIRLEFNLKPIKVITLSDKSDKLVRFDLFERLNTGGVKLSDQEIRSCVYTGDFVRFIKRLSKDENFKAVTKKPTRRETDGTIEELVLRFFAYLYYRESFDHNVRDFLNEFMAKGQDMNLDEMEAIFRNVFTQLRRLEHGIVKSVNGNNTSTILWEAVTVGAAEAIRSGKEQINLNDFYEWVRTPEFNKLVTGATNSKPKIEQRIEFAKQKFMRNE